MDESPLTAKPDLSLSDLEKHDISEMSLDDLKHRINALNAEIARCEQAISARGASRAAAEDLFKS